MKQNLQKNYSVILSGGSGSRLWPLSRKTLPKQYLSFVSSQKSFLQLTLERTKNLVPASHNIIVTTEFQEEMCRLHLANSDYQGQLIIEPASRNTAAAIALVTYKLLEQDPDSFMIILPSDHYIQNIQEFETCIQQSLELAAKDYFVILGIEPTHPATEFGYIEVGKTLENGFKVKSFREKPNFQTATELLSRGNYLWNAGMFVWKTKTFWDEFSKIQPNMAQKISSMTPENQHEIYESLEDIPIDIAFLERSNAIACIKASFDWSDIGSWSAIRDCFSQDLLGNSIHGNVQITDVKNCVVHSSGPFVSVIGLENVGVVVTKDAILVTNLAHAQKVKTIAAKFDCQALG